MSRQVDFDTILYRQSWLITPNENIIQYISRLQLQTEQFGQLIRRRGMCYLLKFKVDDIRPIWECDISPDILRQQILTPRGTQWECPLCQPYDIWDHISSQLTNRRYMCKVVAPQYRTGCIDEDGVDMKCCCTHKGERRKRLKFKTGENKCE